jgi:tRNA pseudouridine38-40 synthase
MPRYRILIEYDGSPYVGWQRQDNGASVQGAIEDAIFGFCGERVGVRGAGRTDAGVHARGQVGHFDLSREWPDATVMNALNAHLAMARRSVAILKAEKAADDFDARFSALKRHYLYRIVNRQAPLTIDAKRAWRVGRPLDAGAMHEAAQRLVGRHDFTTFRSIQCQANSPVRTLDRLDVVRNGETIEIHASAQSFLHNQIRSFAGSLKLVGEGKWTPGDLGAALVARDRAACGPVAPPDGLYFMAVDYPDDPLSNGTGTG